MRNRHYQNRAYIGSMSTCFLVSMKSFYSKTYLSIVRYIAYRRGRQSFWTKEPFFLFVVNSFFKEPNVSTRESQVADPWLIVSRIVSVIVSPQCGVAQDRSFRHRHETLTPRLVSLGILSPN